MYIFLTIRNPSWGGKCKINKNAALTVSRSRRQAHVSAKFLDHSRSVAFVTHLMMNVSEAEPSTPIAREQQALVKEWKFRRLKNIARSTSRNLKSDGQ